MACGQLIDQGMKILVAIANYGSGSRQYVDQVLDTYRQMSHDVDLVILSNIPKDMGEDVEVKVGLPSKNPWSLPFGHKQLFADRIEQYDLFIYSEDDILVSEHAIDSFVQASGDMKPDEITGFMRVEYDAEGQVSYDMVHSFYRWDPRTVRERNGEVYAWLSNEHAAAYILTRDQLQHCIDSGGFLVEPYEHRYDLLCTAATDPYTSCGMTKLLNISRVEDFFVHHLPNKYVGIYGIDAKAMAIQFDALNKIAHGELAAEVMIEVENRLPASRGSKMVYAKPDEALLNAIPAKASDLLVIGAGHGDLERELMSRGHRVTAVPVDSVIGYVLESHGIEVLPADINKSTQQLEGREFDALVFPETLHLFEDPVAVLKAYQPFLRQGGQLSIALPNTGDAKVLAKRLKGDPGYQSLGDYQTTGTHHTTRSNICRWVKQAGYTGVQATGVMTEKRQKMDRLSLGLATGLLADRWLVQASLA